jgi:Putative prokaryotic signal transducing protein
MAMVGIRSYPSRGEAELAQSILAAAGVPSEVSVDDAGGAYPFPLAGSARLLVDDLDAEAATAILRNDPATGVET